MGVLDTGGLIRQSKESSAASALPAEGLLFAAFFPFKIPSQFCMKNLPQNAPKMAPQIDKNLQQKNDKIRLKIPNLILSAFFYQIYSLFEPPNLPKHRFYLGETLIFKKSTFPEIYLKRTVFCSVFDPKTTPKGEKSASKKRSKNRRYFLSNFRRFFQKES